MALIYRLLLWLHPASYRREYGAAMGETFAMRARDAQGRGLGDRVRFHAREFGGLVVSAIQVRRHASDRRRARDLVARDFAHAIRRLRHSPGFATAAVLTLAIGIGGNVAIFTVVNSILISPLPYPGSDRLVRIAANVEAVQATGLELPVGFWLGYREGNETFDDMGLYARTSVNLAGEDAPERVEALSATGSLFATLAVPPVLGRPLIETDEAPGAPSVAVLSHSLWARRYGGDPTIVGRAVRIDGTRVEIVGVMPPGFAFPTPATQMWVPLTIDRGSTPPISFSYGAVGRLSAGVSLEQARADLSRVTGRLPEMFGNITDDFITSNGVSPDVRSYKQTVVGDTADTLWVLLGAVGFVLLIACANVANLFLVRTEARRRELGVRSALGAGRADLIRYLLSESLTIGGVAALAGLALASVAVKVLVAAGPADLPRLEEVGIGTAEFIFTGALAVLASLAFGLLPVLRVVRTQLYDQVREAGSRTTPTAAARRATNALVVCQISLALLLVVGGALFARSFLNLTRIDPGFDASHVLTFRISLPRTAYPDDQRRAVFHQTLTDRLEATPGVVAAGLTRCLPLQGWCGGDPVTSPDSPLPPEGFNKVVSIKSVSPGYFRALGITLREGRPLERRDGEIGTGAVVLSESLAARLFPGGDPIGKRVYPGGGGPDTGDDWYTVVGIAATIKRERLDEEPADVLYASVTGTANQAGPPLDSVTVAVRTEGDPLQWTAAVRDAVWAIDPDVPVAAIEPMTAVLSRASARIAFTAVLIGLAAGAALLLGAVGIYGVVSHAVGRRTAEIGVRMAFGAQRGQVLRMVLGQGLSVSLIGVAVGLAGTLVQARVLRSLLHGISPQDPLTLVVATGSLLMVAALAAYLPARRAAGVDPVLALKHE